MVVMSHRDQNATGSVAVNTRYQRGASPAMGRSARSQIRRCPWRTRPYFLTSLWTRLPVLAAKARRVADVAARSGEALGDIRPFEARYRERFRLLKRLFAERGT